MDLLEDTLGSPGITVTPKLFSWTEPQESHRIPSRLLVLVCDRACCAAQSWYWTRVDNGNEDLRYYGGIYGPVAIRLLGNTAYASALLPCKTM